MSGTARHGTGIRQGGRPQAGDHGRSECARKHWARQEHLARRESSKRNLRETTVCKGPRDAVRATGKMGDQEQSQETAREDITTRETMVC